jgi:hypothetical protein
VLELCGIEVVVQGIGETLGAEIDLHSPVVAHQ